MSEKSDAILKQLLRLSDERLPSIGFSPAEIDAVKRGFIRGLSDDASKPQPTKREGYRD